MSDLNNNSFKALNIIISAVYQNTQYIIMDPHINKYDKFIVKANLAVTPSEEFPRR